MFTYDDASSQGWYCEIPDGIEEIDSYCFNESSRTNSLVIPYSVTKFGKNCFDNSPIETIQIYCSINSIPRDIFLNCRKLEKIDIDSDDSCVIFGNKIFKNNPYFEQAFYLPNSITKINDEKFDKLSSCKITSFVT